MLEKQTGSLTNKTLLKIKVEAENLREGALVIGKTSNFYSCLSELLQSRNLEINNGFNFAYVFLAGDYQNIENYLVKASRRKAKFFLILEGENLNKDQKKAQDLLNFYLRNKKIEGKIIYVSGYEGSEIEICHQILKKCFSAEKETLVSFKNPSFETKKPEGKKGTNFFWWLVIAFFILIMPLFYLFLNSFLGVWSLNQSYQFALNSNFAMAKISSLSSQNYFKNSLWGAKLFYLPMQILGKEKEETKFLKIFEAGSNLSLAAGHLAEVAQKGQKIIQDLFNSDSFNLETEISSLMTTISLAEEELALVEAQEINLPIFKTQMEKVQQLRQGLAKIKSFLPMASQVLGFEKPKTYLLLLQNNFELRPGGGFIGTVGFLTLNEGKMDLRLQDVYTLDGELKGHVEPPRAIKDYLNQPHWFLRDSNFDPFFPVNAQRALWFVEKETGNSLDGVIALDLFLAGKILETLGPLEVSDYQEQITAGNLFFKAQTYIQTDFFPGSTQKKDFLSAVAQALFSRLTTDKNLPYLKLTVLAQEAFAQKHLMVYWADPLLEEITLRQRWGGGIESSNDYLMVVDANLGVNKVNYFIKKEISKKVNFTQNGADSVVSIDYQNTSPKGVNFGGDYKNYLRILSDKNWSLQKVIVGGAEVKKIDTEEINGKNSAGFLIDVPAGQTLTVTVFYHRELDPSSYPLNYQILIQKQAGTDNDRLHLELTSQLGVVKKELLRYNGDLLTDHATTQTISRITKN